MAIGADVQFGRGYRLEGRGRGADPVDLADPTARPGRARRRDIVSQRRPDESVRWPDRPPHPWDEPAGSRRSASPPGSTRPMPPDTGHRSRSGGCGRFRHRERCTARAHRPRGNSADDVDGWGHRRRRRSAPLRTGFEKDDWQGTIQVGAAATSTMKPLYPPISVGAGFVATRPGTVLSRLVSAPTPRHRRRARCRRGSPTPGYVARHRGDDHHRQRIARSSRPPERRAVDLRPTRRHRAGEGRKECRRKALLSGRDGLGTRRRHMAARFQLRLAHTVRVRARPARPVAGDDRSSGVAHASSTRASVMV